MGETSSHRQHSQDEPAHLQPLVLCGHHAWGVQGFLHEMLLHPLLELAVQGAAIGINLSMPGWLLPTHPWWQWPAALHAATVLISCSTPIPLWLWVPALHFIAALILGCGILSQRMQRSHPFESVHHFLLMTQIGICPLQRNPPVYHSLARSRVLHEQMQIICKMTFCLSKSMK